jgi:hypothetical protein
MGMGQCAGYALALSLALVACGSDGSTTGTSSGEPTVPAPTAPAPSGPSTATPAPTNTTTPPTDPPKSAVPPPFPAYSHGTCPTLVSGPTKPTSINTGFASGSQTRSFNLIVPPSYDGSKPYPIFFAWHWLNASAGSFISQGELESATEQMKFIAIVPDELQNADGKKVYQMDWPFVETWGAEGDLVFIDDLLACVSHQFEVDPTRVYGIGVSAGALWATYVSTTSRVKHFAAIESLSGGLGADPVGVWSMKWVPQPNKFPALVLWGGSSDFLGVDFQKASQRYRDELRMDGHFVVQCTHSAGHTIPPVDPPPNGVTKFRMLWQFMLDHPYGTPAGTSPYKTQGLPSIFPSWCSVAP